MYLSLLESRLLSLITSRGLKRILLSLLQKNYIFKLLNV